MNIKVEFDYHSKVIFIPNGYIENADKLQETFLEWVEEQPECIEKDHANLMALSYDEQDFLKYINEVVLQKSNEKAYFVKDEKRVKVNVVMKF